MMGDVKERVELEAYKLVLQHLINETSLSANIIFADKSLENEYRAASMRKVNIIVRNVLDRFNPPPKPKLESIDEGFDEMVRGNVE